MMMCVCWEQNEFGAYQEPLLQTRIDFNPGLDK